MRRWTRRSFTKTHIVHDPEVLSVLNQRLWRTNCATWTILGLQNGSLRTGCGSHKDSWYSIRDSWRKEACQSMDHHPTKVWRNGFNVLTAKVRSVSPWGSRFNLGSQGLTTFHMWWSRFPTLDGDISQWHAWGLISFLETAQIFWSHVAYQQYHGSSYKVMSRTPKWGRDWATGRFGLQLVEYKECQK